MLAFHIIFYFYFLHFLSFSSAGLLVTNTHSIDTLSTVEGELSLQKGSGIDLSTLFCEGCGSLGVRLGLRVQVRGCHDEIKVVLSDADLVQIWPRLRLFASSGLAFLVRGLLGSCVVFLAGAAGLGTVVREQVKR